MTGEPTAAGVLGQRQGASVAVLRGPQRLDPGVLAQVLRGLLTLSGAAERLVLRAWGWPSGSEGQEGKALGGAPGGHLHTPVGRDRVPEHLFQPLDRQVERW